MRIVVVADVHANLDAFEAVLRHAAAGGAIDRVWSLGDLVGYGAQPSTCIARLREFEHVELAGNHDLAAAGEIGLAEFNTYAADAALWTASQLDDDEKAWIRGLPRVVIEQNVTLVHGSLRDPVWEYLLSESEAEAHLALQTTPYGLVGHTHFPAVIYEGDAAMRRILDGREVALEAERFVANPGSVGQPRDGDYRAAYAVLDTEARRFVFDRVDYDVAAARAKIVAAGLPTYLAERLARGR
ncbi:MAG TPA: metallophosphoesterase family protein [Dehalococcoidia bacterium]|nr:metallophosphoesterase family protein [Dehalococcoidia bacterium]